AQAIHLAHAGAGRIDQERTFLDHLADFGFDQVVPLDLGLDGLADVCAAHRLPASLPGDIAGLAGQVREIGEARRYLAAATRLAHAVFNHRRDRRTVERAEPLVLREFAQATTILEDDL